MAATTQYSPEYNQDAQAPALGSFDQSAYRLVFLPFNFVQDGAGDAASLMYLRKLPTGRIIFFPILSRITWEAFGGSRTLDIGHGAYTEPDGDAISASAALFDDNVDVSSAGDANMCSDFIAATTANTGGMKEFWSKDGVPIYATVAGGTIPDGTNLTGYLVVGVL